MSGVAAEDEKLTIGRATGEKLTIGVSRGRTEGYQLSWPALLTAGGFEAKLLLPTGKLLTCMFPSYNFNLPIVGDNHASLQSTLYCFFR